MARPSGFYLAILDEPPADYRIRIELYSGETLELDDPYRFPPLLTPFELTCTAKAPITKAIGRSARTRSTCEGVEGVRFAVWAPERAGSQRDRRFQRLGSHPPSHAPARRRHLGDFRARPRHGEHYKYSVLSERTEQQDKCDPYGFFAEVPPKTASIVWPLTNYTWNDADWMEARARRNILHEAVSIYEVHLESWLRGPGNRALTYRELARKTRRVRAAHGLHAPGADAGDGASFFRLLGLSGHRLLRAHLALRHARRLPLFRRPLPSGRHRRDSRLGARPFSARSLTACGASTAPRFTNTPIRARASIAIGAR